MKHISIFLSYIFISKTTLTKNWGFLAKPRHITACHLHTESVSYYAGMMSLYNENKIASYLSIF